ncbi:MAG: hypothetical protein JNJ54_30705 [Myxococcaceae bacterium]|nr:hypothetical protein [Myxococcaceae bacterium]
MLTLLLLAQPLPSLLGMPSSDKTFGHTALKEKVRLDRAELVDFDFEIPSDAYYWMNLRVAKDVLSGPAVVAPGPCEGAADLSAGPPVVLGEAWALSDPWRLPLGQVLHLEESLDYGRKRYFDLGTGRSFLKAGRYRVRIGVFGAPVGVAPGSVGELIVRRNPDQHARSSRDPSHTEKEVERLERWNRRPTACSWPSLPSVEALERDRLTLPEHLSGLAPLEQLLLRQYEAAAAAREEKLDSKELSARFARAFSTLTADDALGPFTVQGRLDAARLPKRSLREGRSQMTRTQRTVELRIDEPAWRAADLAAAFGRPTAVAQIVGPPPWELAPTPDAGAEAEPFFIGHRAVMHVMVSAPAGDARQPSRERLVVTGVRLVAQLD